MPEPNWRPIVCWHLAVWCVCWLAGWLVGLFGLFVCVLQLDGSLSMRNSRANTETKPLESWLKCARCSRALEMDFNLISIPQFNSISVCFVWNVINLACPVGPFNCSARIGQVAPVHKLRVFNNTQTQHTMHKTQCSAHTHTTSAASHWQTATEPPLKWTGRPIAKSARAAAVSHTHTLHFAV